MQGEGVKSRRQQTGAEAGETGAGKGRERGGYRTNRETRGALSV